MDFYEITIINSILTMFPILIYFIYLVYNYDFDKEANELILDLSLVTSFYLTYKIDSANISYFLIFVPLLISYLRKRTIPIVFVFIMTISSMHIYLFIAETIIYLLSLAVKEKKQFIISFLFVNTIAVFLINIYAFTTTIFIEIMVESIIGILITVFIIKLFDQSSKLINIYMDLKDVKKETKIQESLFKITHEIKNPIAVCKGYLDMYDVNSIEHSKKYIPIIKEEIERTLILLKDFLSLRKITLDKEELDLTILFDEVIEEMSLYNESKVKFNKHYKDEIYVDGDYNRLKQVVLNIIKNSIESIKDNGIIDISIETKKEIIVKIKDNGEGMSKETLKKFKEPFYTTKNNGTGLGVPLSFEIIEAHGWEINYDSALNVGTTVTIIIA